MFGSDDYCASNSFAWQGLNNRETHLALDGMRKVFADLRAQRVPKDPTEKSNRSYELWHLRSTIDACERRLATVPGTLSLLTVAQQQFASNQSRKSQSLKRLQN